MVESLNFIYEKAGVLISIYQDIKSVVLIRAIVYEISF